jgi:hypothetical protein
VTVDCAGSSLVFDDAGFEFVAGFAGPDILFPLVWRGAKKLTVLGLSHRMFATIWARVSGLYFQLHFNFGNAGFQVGDTLADREYARKQAFYTFGRCKPFHDETSLDCGRNDGDPSEFRSNLSRVRIPAQMSSGVRFRAPFALKARP